MQAHAFVIEGGTEAGIARALEHVEGGLGLEVKGNPDVLVLRYGLFSVEDARRVAELASEAPFSGTARAIIIAADRAYRESQNALLKLFEEPPKGVTLFLVLPTLGGLLPTLRSRVSVLRTSGGTEVNELARGFLASASARASIVKKLTSGKDEDDRRENRDEALMLVEGIERAAYENGVEKNAALLAELGILRSYLYDRSAPVKMILEHLSLVTPRGLGVKA
jgi:hypothetical protein